MHRSSVWRQDPQFSEPSNINYPFPLHWRRIFSSVKWFRFSVCFYKSFHIWVLILAIGSTLVYVIVATFGPFGWTTAAEKRRFRTGTANAVVIVCRSSSAFLGTWWLISPFFCRWCILRGALLSPFLLALSIVMIAFFSNVLHNFMWSGCCIDILYRMNNS
jgi:hypothetical protein